MPMALRTAPFVTILLAALASASVLSRADEPQASPPPPASAALSASPAPLPRSLTFSLATDDPASPLQGQVDLPDGLACADGAPRHGAVVLVPGTGWFDRDADFGTTGTEKDLLFRALSQDLTARGVVVGRFDTRGVRCSLHTAPKGTDASKVIEACVSREARRAMSADKTAEDIARVHDHVRSLPCVDQDRVAVFAHSEGTIHVSRLVARKRIRPNALIYLGMVATSAKKIVHWQSVDRTLARIQRATKATRRFRNSDLKTLGFSAGLTRKGYWTADEARLHLEEAYARRRAEETARPDDELHLGFWPYRYWRMWWNDDEPIAPLLRGFDGWITAHFAEKDESTPGRLEQVALVAVADDLVHPPKIVTHENLGHSLGADGLMGPMDETARKKLVDSIVWSARSEAEPKRDLSDVPYFGLTFGPSDPLSKEAREAAHIRSERGLRVNLVVPAHPAWNAGLRVGDLILAMDGIETGLVPPDDMAAKFARRVRELVPGSKALLKTLRWKTRAEATRGGEKAEAPNFDAEGAAEAIGRHALSAEPGREHVLRWSREPEIRDVGIEAVRPIPPAVRKLPPRAPGAVPEMERLAERLVAHYGKKRDYEDLLTRLADMTVRPDPFRIAEIDWIQHHPFELHRASSRIIERIGAREGSPLDVAARALAEAIRRLRKPEDPPEDPDDGVPPAPLHTGLSPDRHLDQIAGRLEAATKEWDAAFAGLSEPERATLRGSVESLSRRLLEWNYVYSDPDPFRLTRHLEAIHLAARVDLRPLARALRSLLPLADPAYVAGLRRDIQGAKLRLDVPEVLSRKTPFGEILISGTGDDTHRDIEKRQIAVLIDLGGNDLYANRAGASTEKTLVSVLVDAAGDDEHDSPLDGAQGAGTMGIGLLADLAGNDRYGGARFAQGAGLVGAGALVDFSGNDRYDAHHYAQGATLFGISVLSDGSGDDRYSARTHSQAAAIAGGAAILADRAGNDEYRATGAQISGYETPGNFDGWSQGIGLGIRFLVSGGLAVLLDGGGRDRMDGGDFSQGGGYWYGWGILEAAGREADRYVGGRYSQGFSAHAGLATFLERGGDDWYESKGFVSTGLANDLSLAWFEDEAGDDRYPARSFSLGASANSSICVFVDRGGRNRYVGGEPPANGQTNEYHEGMSLSLAFDLGTPLGPRGGRQGAPSPYALDGLTLSLPGGPGPGTLLVSPSLGGLLPRLRK